MGRETTTTTSTLSRPGEGRREGERVRIPYSSASSFCAGFKFMQRESVYKYGKPGGFVKSRALVSLAGSLEERRRGTRVTTSDEGESIAIPVAFDRIGLTTLFDLASSCSSFFFLLRLLLLLTRLFIFIFQNIFYIVVEKREKWNRLIKWNGISKDGWIAQM